MKKLLIILSLALPLPAVSQTIDTLTYERFETGGSTFTLNTGDLGSITSPASYNEWVVNNAYSGGNGQVVCLGFPFTFTINSTSPQPPLITGGANTNYMHILSDAAQGLAINNCNYLASDGICNLDENNFTKMTQDVSTVGYDSVAVSFLWICAGGTNIYGEIYYSTNGGLSWNPISTPVSQYRNQTNWGQQYISLPAFTQQPTLRFGFRFVNQSSNSANDPGFGIDEFLITASVASPPPVAAFTVSNDELCQSGCVDFTDMSTGNPVSWFWIFQGATTAFTTQQNPMQICYNAPGIYDVTLIVTNASGSDTLTIAGVEVHPNPPVPVVTLSNDTLYTTPGYQSYQWYLNGGAIAGAVNDFHVVLMDGAYTVEITDTNGCMNVSDSLNFTTGISQTEIASFEIFPNPASQNIYINGSLKAEHIIINDITGRMVINEREISLPYSMDVSTLPKGVYLLQIKFKNEIIAPIKIIKD